MRGGGEGGRERALVYMAEDGRLRTTACLAEARRALRVPGAWAEGTMSTGHSHGRHGGSRRLGGGGKTIGDNTDVPELVSVAMGLIKTLEIEFSDERGEKNTSTTQHTAVYHLPWFAARLALAGGRSAGGFWAGSAQRVDVHRMVVSEEALEGIAGGVLRVAVGGRREKDDACLAGASARLQFQAPQGSRRQGRCSSQKGSGAEAVCHECINGKTSR